MKFHSLVHWIKSQFKNSCHRRKSVRNSHQVAACVETLEPRQLLTITVEPQFGPETQVQNNGFNLSNAPVHLIFWGSYWTANPDQKTAVENTAGALLSSPFLGITQQYGSDGKAFLSSSATDGFDNWKVDFNGQNYSDSNSTPAVSIDNVVQAKIITGFLPEPKATVNPPIYVVVTPPGCIVPQAVGFNQQKWFGNISSHQDLFEEWASTSSNNNNPNGPVNLDTFSRILSHEIAESMSDPGGQGFEFQPPPGAPNNPSQATQGQIGDFEPDGGNYVFREPNGVLVQAVWSEKNKAFVVANGTQQQLFLTPQWNGSSFNKNYSLDIDCGQLGIVNNRVTLTTTSNGSLAVTLNGETTIFDSKFDNITGIKIYAVGSSTTVLANTSIPLIIKGRGITDVVITGGASNPVSVFNASNVSLTGIVSSNVTINGNGQTSVELYDARDIFGTVSIAGAGNVMVDDSSNTGNPNLNLGSTSNGKTGSISGMNASGHIYYTDCSGTLTVQSAPQSASGVMANIVVDATDMSTALINSGPTVVSVDVSTGMISEALSVANQMQATSLVINDLGDTRAHPSVVLTSTPDHATGQIFGFSSLPISYQYAGINALDVFLGSTAGNMVYTWMTGVPTTVIGGSSDDAFNVGDPEMGLQNISGLKIDASAGSTLNVSDRPTTSQCLYSLDSNSSAQDLSRFTEAGGNTQIVTYRGISQFFLKTASNDFNTVVINSFPSSIAQSIICGGNDAIEANTPAGSTVPFQVHSGLQSQSLDQPLGTVSIWSPVALANPKDVNLGVRITTGSGKDSFVVGDDGVGLDGMSRMDIESSSSGTNAIWVVDSGSASSHSYSLNTGLFNGKVLPNGVSIVRDGAITLTSNSNVSSLTLATSRKNGNTVAVQATLVPTTIDNLGQNTFSANNIPLIGGPLYIEGTASAINLDDSADKIFGQTALIPLLGKRTVGASQGQIVFPDRAVIQYNYASTSSLSVKTGNAGGSVMVYGTGAPTLITTGTLGGTFAIDDSKTRLDNIQGSLTLNGNGGTNTLRVDDRASNGNYTYSIADSQIVRTGVAPIRYSGMSKVTVEGSNGSNSFVVSDTPTSPTTLVGGSGQNVLSANSKSKNGPDQILWVLDGTDSGSLQNDNLAFSSIQNLIGIGLNKFKFTPTGRIDGTITGQGRGSYLDFSRDGKTPIAVSLQTGAATQVNGGFAGGINNLAGVIGSSSGANTLIGPDAGAAWNITGMDSGTVAGFSFVGIEHLIGGAGPDTFSIIGNGSVETIDGGQAPANGGNWLDYSAFIGPNPARPTTAVVNLAIGQATNIGGGLAGTVTKIQNVRGASPLPASASVQYSTTSIVPGVHVDMNGVSTWTTKGRLSWSAVPGATGYSVNVYNGGQLVSSDTTSITAMTMSLTGGQTYRFIVSALAQAWTGASATTTAQTPVPSAVPFSNFSWNPVMNKSTGNVDGQITWSNVSGAASYRVSEYIDDDSGRMVAYGSSSSVAPQGGSSTIQVRGLLPGSMMKLVSEALDANGNLLSFSSGAVYAISQTAILNIQNVAVTTSGAQSVSEQLSWEAVTGAQFYRVYQWDPINDKYTVVDDNLLPTQNSSMNVTISNLKRHTAYEFVVEAYCGPKKDIFSVYHIPVPKVGSNG